MLFILCLLGIIGVLFYSSTNSPFAIRRKPKRTPKKPLLEQIEEAFFSFLPWLSSLVQNPVVLLMESTSLLHNLSVSPEQGAKKLHRAPQDSWGISLRKIGEIFLSSIWNFILGVVARKARGSPQQIDHPKIEVEVKCKKESFESPETCLTKPKPLAEPELLLVVPDVEDIPEPPTQESPICKTQWDQLGSTKLSQDENSFVDVPQRERTVSDCEPPKVPPQLPIRIQTKKERRNEKIKKSTGLEVIRDYQETTLLSEDNPETLSKPVKSEHSLELPLEGSGAEGEPPIVEMSPCNDFLPLSDLQVHEISDPIRDACDLILPEDQPPSLEMAIEICSNPTSLVVGLLSDVTCVGGTESMLALDPFEEPISETLNFGPPPGFPDCPHDSPRLSLLADLNETSEVFVEPLDLSRIDTIGGATLPSRSLPVGFSHSPLYDGPIDHQSYGGNPFYSGDVDWSQPFFEAVISGNEDLRAASHLREESGLDLRSDDEINYSQSVLSTLSEPSSHYVPNYDREKMGAQWPGDEYYGISYPSPPQSQFPHQHQGYPAVYPNGRRSDYSRGPRYAQSLSSSRTAIPSSWMQGIPNWQYHAQLSVNQSFSSPSQPPLTEFSPTIKITFTVRTRLLPPSKVAQVKVILFSSSPSLISS